MGWHPRAQCGVGGHLPQSGCDSWRGVSHGPWDQLRWDRPFLPGHSPNPSTHAIGRSCPPGRIRQGPPASAGPTPPASAQHCNLRQHVIPEPNPNSGESFIHKIPVNRTNTIPPNACRSGTRKTPHLPSTAEQPGGTSGATPSHNSTAANQTNTTPQNACRSGPRKPPALPFTAEQRGGTSGSTRSHNSSAKNRSPARVDTHPAPPTQKRNHRNNKQPSKNTS